MMTHEPQTFSALRGTLARDVRLARYTSWRCGGPGDRVYVPADRDDLATFVRQLPPDEPLTAIGLAHLVGLQGPALQAGVLQASMPTAVITTILALEFDVLPNFVTSVVCVATLLSPLTVTLLIAYLQNT